MNGLAALFVLAAAAPSAAKAPLFSYHVHPHESLYDIGQRGLDPASGYLEVQRINQVRDPGHLPVGKVIRIPYPLLKTTPITVTVEGFRGDVEVEAAGGHAKAVVGRQIGEGAIVATGDSAFARLSLPDGSHIVLPSDSRVRFDRLRAIVLTGALDRALTLQKGRAESTVTPMTDPDSRYVISTPVAVTSVRGTVFRTAFDPSTSHEAAGVLRGAISVSNAKTESMAHADQGITATPAGVSGPKALLPAPTLVQADFPQTEDISRFEITPVVGARSYRLTLATDEAISAPVLEKTFEGAAVEIATLPDGSYYAQVSAIAPDGLEGKAAVYPIIRVRNGLKIETPRKEGEGYVFNWDSAGEAPATFHFTLRRAGDAGPPLVDEPALTEKHFAVKALAPGAYTWQVKAIRRRDGRRVEAYTDPQILQIPH